MTFIMIIEHFSELLSGFVLSGTVTFNHFFLSSPLSFLLSHPFSFFPFPFPLPPHLGMGSVWALWLSPLGSGLMHFYAFLAVKTRLMASSFLVVSVQRKWLCFVDMSSEKNSQHFGVRGVWTPLTPSAPFWYSPDWELLLCSVYLCHLLLGGITLAQAITPIAAHFSVAWSVCLSVVCHIRAPCVNCCWRI